jgi:CRISPR type III-A-associated protein Csm2
MSQQRQRKSQKSDSAASLGDLEGGFFDAEGNLRADLLDGVATSFGKQFATKDRVSNAQLRRFYGDVKELQKDIRADAEAAQEIQAGPGREAGPAFHRYEARVRMLKSKVAYAAGRRTIPVAFQRFVSACIDQVDSLPAFDAYVTFFETVVGYFYGFGGERNR